MAEHYLEVQNIKVRYSRTPILNGVSIRVNKGECISVVGANGVGKSTLLRAIMGTLPCFEGKILFQGDEIQNKKTETIVSKGIVYVPEEKMLFKPLNVLENLLLGAYTKQNRDEIERNLSYVFELFPRLKERRKQAASTLSGGEQQMVAIGRGLMSSPKILMLDEPSLGLAPLLVDEVLDKVALLKKEGMTILIVEQNVQEALALADRGYVIRSGKVYLEGTGQELLQNNDIRKAYLGL